MFSCKFKIVIEKVSPPRYLQQYSNFDLFLNNLHDILSFLTKNHPTVILTGDINIHAMTDSAENRLYILHGFGLKPLLKLEPTGVVIDFSPSALDHVFTNDQNITAHNSDFILADHKAQIIEDHLDVIATT